jgi:hypothetical protein
VVRNKLLYYRVGAHPYSHSPIHLSLSSSSSPRCPAGSGDAHAVFNGTLHHISLIKTGFSFSGRTPLLHSHLSALAVHCHLCRPPPLLLIPDPFLFFFVFFLVIVYYMHAESLSNTLSELSIPDCFNLRSLDLAQRVYFELWHAPLSKSSGRSTLLCAKFQLPKSLPGSHGSPEFCCFNVFSLYSLHSKL